MAEFGLADNEYAYYLLAAALILVVSLIIHLLLHRVVIRLIGHSRREDRAQWRQALFGGKLFSRLALTVQGVVVYTLAGTLLASETVAMQVIEMLTHLWIILFSLLALFSLLDAIETLSRGAGPAAKLPLRGIFQSVKLAASSVALILAIAFLIGKSPLILFSGLGAMTAVVLLIFKDPILGLVAGIQLSANNMLRVDDWLEMPQYGADGDVIDISLTTVKVRNWDNTITSIPSYALISDSFKNWRNIEEVGGRRIKRSIYLDVNSVRFATQDDLERLHRAHLLAEYIEDKVAEIKTVNQADDADATSPMNKKQLTNIGLLRAYLLAYLRNHPDINTRLTHMVRQLEAGPHGIPLQVYGFVRHTSWIPYESVQSDIFDHIYSIVPEFGLRLFQAPSGHDVQFLAQSPVLTHAGQSG
ncbi:MAG: mechanosensitive ion channel [Wenzhouxiangellaceae bacterium]